MSGRNTGWTRGTFDCDKNIWTHTEAEAGWFGEVWPARDADGWRYAFHCRHTLPNPDFPGSETFLHCHGSDGPSRDVYATSEAAMVACEQATARGFPAQNTSLGQLARERLGIAADS